MDLQLISSKLELELRKLSYGPNGDACNKLSYCMENQHECRVVFLRNKTQIVSWLLVFKDTRRISRDIVSDYSIYAWTRSKYRRKKFASFLIKYVVRKYRRKVFFVYREYLFKSVNKKVVKNRLFLSSAPPMNYELES